MVRWSITANQKNLKNEKKKKKKKNYKNKKKNSNNFLVRNQKKNYTKLPWPMSAKSDKKVFHSEKIHKITMAHECKI